MPSGLLSKLQHTISTRALKSGAKQSPPPQHQRKQPWALEFRSNKWFIVVVVALSVFTDLFLYGIIVPVIPFALKRRVGIAPEHVQSWVSVLLAVYGAALVVISPIVGYMADRTASRRLPYLLGLITLAGATVLLCIGTSIGLLIAGRILQGFSAAVVWVVGLALLVDTVGERDIGQMMGYVGIGMSLAILLAPLLGGIVYASAGYYAVFAMAFGLLGVDIVLRFTMIERKVAAQWLHEDPNPANDHLDEQEKPDRTSMAEVCVEGLQQHDHSKEIKTLDTSQTCDASGNLPERSTSQIIHEDRNLSSPQESASKPNSKLPPVITLLRSRRLLAGLWVSAVAAGLMTSFDSVLPLRVRHVFGWDSLGAGLIFLPLIVPTFIGPFVGAISDRYGPRYLVTAGLILAVAPLTCLRFVTHNSLGQKALLCGLLAIIGVAIDFIMTPIMGEVCYAVEAKEKKAPGMFGKGGAYAQAYALFNMAFAAGVCFGPIWAGLINQHAGWSTMSWSLGLLCAATTLPALGWVGGWIGKGKQVRKSRETNEPNV